MDQHTEEVEILPLEQVIKLLRFVEQVPQYHCMVVPLALQIFCGLRRVEIKRLPLTELQKKLGDEFSVLPKRTRSPMNRWVTNIPVTICS